MWTFSPFPRLGSTLESFAVILARVNLVYAAAPVRDESLIVLSLWIVGAAELSLRRLWVDDVYVLRLEPAVVDRQDDHELRVEFQGPPAPSHPAAS